MTRQLRFIFGDQLTSELSALVEIDPAHDVILMVKASAEARNVPQPSAETCLRAVNHASFRR